MKKTYLTILMAVIFFAAFAQENTDQVKVYKNEFGIDATGFLKQIINFDPTQSYPDYSPNYYLTYRRHFKSGNIRFAVGGSFSNISTPSDLATGPKYFYDNTYSFCSRIGWEFFNDLSKHWQVFYGLDFIPSFYHQKTDKDYTSGGYAKGSENKNQGYGIAPVLGFKFKLTNRLSIMTEINYSLVYLQSEHRNYYTPLLDSSPALPDEKTKSKNVFGSFSQPFSLFLLFDI